MNLSKKHTIKIINMGKIEKLLCVVSAIAILLQGLSVPGGKFLTTVFLGAVVVIYMTFSIFIINGIRASKVFSGESYKMLTFSRKVGSVVYGFVISLGILGILYDLQNWEGANNILVASLVFMIITLFFILYKFLSTKNKFYRQLIIRLGIVVFISLIFLLF